MISLAAVLWGAGGVVARYFFASSAVPPLLLVQARMGMAALLLLVGLAFKAPHLLRISRKDWGIFALFGVLGMAGVQFSYLLTLSETNVATAIFLQYLSPVITALYLSLVRWRWPDKKIIVCLALALPGSSLLILGGGAKLLISPLGLASGLSSAIFMSFYTIWAAKLLERLSPWVLLCFAMSTGFLFWMLVDGGLLLLGRPVPGAALLHSPEIWILFLYIGILATLVPFVLYLTGLRSVSPTSATLTGMLEPVVGGGASYLVLGERMAAIQVAGGALIIAAVILLQAQHYQARESVSQT